MGKKSQKEESKYYKRENKVKKETCKGKKSQFKKKTCLQSDCEMV